jgi:hypothetical protein
MQELINSVARFSAAVTMFGLQEIQNAIGTGVDAQDYMSRFRQSLDSITNAVSAELDATSKPALDSLTNLSSDVVGRTFETLKTPVFDPRQMLQTATDLIRRTADSVAKPVATSASVATAPLGESGVGEPVAVESALIIK